MSRIPQITIGADYFRTTARKESYYSLVFRWVKETLQNSYDAGATLYSLTMDDRDNSFTCVDNAGGMDEDTLLDTFLSIGGSKKDRNENTVGGFGEAKKIICFCWDNWSVHTQDNFLDESLIGVEIKKIEEFNGTKIKVNMGKDYNVTEAINYLNLCQLDGIEIKCLNVTSDGNILEIPTQKLYKRKIVKELEIGTFHVNKSNSSNRLIVRLNGLALFTEHIFADIPATCVLELKSVCDPKSDEYILNSTRERLVYKYSSVIDNLISDICSNPTSVLSEKDDSNNNVNILKGNGSCSGIRRPKSVLSEQDAILREVDEFLFNDDKIIDSNSLSVDVVNVEKKNKSSELQDIFPYDIVIKGKPTMKTDSLKCKKVLLAWHKAIEYVCYYNTINDSVIELSNYKVGFTFDENTKAERCVLSNGDIYYLINPTDFNNSNFPWQGMVMEILNRAAHEVTHNFYSNHDGMFVAMEAELRMKCLWYVDEILSKLGAICRSSSSNINGIEVNEEYDFDL